MASKAAAGKKGAPAAAAQNGPAKNGPTILKCDITTPELTEKIMELAKEAVGKYEIEKDVAAHIKKAMDLHLPSSTWHCIVGTHFGTSLSHATKNLIFFSIGGTNILLWRSLD